MSDSVIRNKARKALVHFFLYAVTAFLLFPLFWMIMTSFKPRHEWVTYPPTWIPTEPTFSNYLFIIFGSGSAMKKCEKIKSKTMKRISGYVAELYKTEIKEIYFINKSDDILDSSKS